MPRIVKKPEERKSEIIIAARRLFETKGYANTSMQDVMLKLNIAKGTIYHYFKSKEELLEAVVESIVNDSVARMERTLKESSGNALHQFKTLVREGNISAENKDLLDQIHNPENAAMHIRLLALSTSRISAIYAKVIEQGCKEGLFKTAFPLEAAEFIVAAISFLTDVGIYPWSDHDLKRRSVAFGQLIEQQLNAKPGSFDFMSDV